MSRLYHRLTSYTPDREWNVPVDDPRIVQGFEPNVPERMPPFLKQYDAGLPRVALPRELPSTAAAATAVLAGTADITPQSLDLGQLARVLFLSAGVVRVAERIGHEFLFRAAGSAGARFPLEVYVAVPDGGALPPGVHWYDGREHALVQVAPPPVGGDPTLVVTGVPWRTGWRYAERGYRHIYWDAGTLIAQQLALTASAGLPAALFTEFADGAVADLVGADGVHEFPVAVLCLGATPALQSGGGATAGRIDTDPLEFPLVTATQRAGDRGALGAPWLLDADPIADAPPSEPVDAVIRRRGSMRRMDRTRTVPREVLTFGMAAALRGVDVRHAVAVHGVDDVAPGVYWWPDLDAALQSGDQRAELLRISLDQDLGGDAAYVAIATADVDALDDRMYRAAHLGAGIVEGRLHLLAYALGYGASGMTFLDSEIPALLREPVSALLFTCVGVPEYTSKQAGEPGAPAVVRPVTPRISDSRP
jgi:hypothetical protein